MWIYEKKLQKPVKIANSDPAMAKIIITQLGGPDGETGAAMRYLSQRYAMPNNKVKAVLTDIGTEELGHMEMISAIVHQLTRNLSIEEIKSGGFAPYFADHTTGIYPVDASGVPFNAATFQSTGDPIADLNEDLAAEQKARATYEHLMNMTANEQIIEPLFFLREREIVHYQRFGECLDILQNLHAPACACRCRTRRGR